MGDESAGQTTRFRKARRSKSTNSSESEQEAEFFQPNRNVFPNNILYMQRTIGNQAVQRKILDPYTELKSDQGTGSAVEKPKPSPDAVKEQARLEKYAGYVQQLVPLGVIDEEDYKKFDERLHGEETQAGLEDLGAARKGKGIKEAERTFRDVLNQDIASKVNAKIAQTSAVTQAAIDRSFGGINDLLQKRIYFLVVMPKYFAGKTVDDAINHFKDVNPVTVPGMPKSFAVHAAINERLEKVAGRMQALGMPMPETDVGFGLRDRFNPDDLSAAGLMVHALGIAIDFRATTNQHYKDTLKQTLRDTLIGGEGRLNLPDPKNLKKVSGSYAYGYELTIRKMGAEMMANGQLDEGTAKEAEAFYQKFDSEYNRLSSASHTLVEQSKKSGITGLLQQGRDMLDRKAALHKEIEGYQKTASALGKYEGRTVDDKTSKADKAKIQSLQQTLQNLRQASVELLAVNLRIFYIKSQLPVVFEDWLKKIDAKSGAIEKKLPDFEKIPALKDIMEGEKNIAKYQEERSKLAQEINDLHIPKKSALKVGKLNPKEFDRETGVVKNYSQYFQNEYFHQFYLQQIQILAPMLLTEEMGLLMLKSAAKGSPEQQTAEDILNAARLVRQGLAVFPLIYSSAEQKALSKDKLTLAQVRYYKDKYNKILDKESYDSTRQQTMLDQLSNSSKLSDDLDNERKEYKRAIAGYKVAEAGKNSSKPEARAAYEAKEEYLQYRRLKDLREKLLHDETFVFGASSELQAADPSVWQFAKFGFFSPDEEPEGRKSMSTEDWNKYMRRPAGEKSEPPAKPLNPSRREGFNQNFMRLMTLFGFDLGSAWHGAQDSMHFELIEMKEKIAKP